MDKDQVKEVLKDAVDLPQIRSAVRGTKDAGELAAAGELSAAGELAAEQVDIKKLGKLVEGSFGAIANATGLSVKEVLHVLEGIHVDMLKDVLKDDPHADELRKAIQEAIKNISLATALDTQQITAIFTEKKDTDLDDIVIRLHHSSQASRGMLAAV